MDMVIDILGYHGRELGSLQYLFQICQSLCLSGSIELVQNFNIDHI